MSNPFEPGHPIWCARKLLFELSGGCDPWPAGITTEWREEYRRRGWRALRAAVDLWAAEAADSQIDELMSRVGR